MNSKNTDVIDLEASRCESAYEYILKSKNVTKAKQILANLIKQLKENINGDSIELNTEYENTIALSDQGTYPGDLELESKIENIVRWNAMTMVVKANREHDGLGGHISTFASSGTLYEVGQNHIFKGPDGEDPADMVFFQGHASPGNYARAYIEGRLPAKKLHNFRQELSKEGGLSSYPHPYLMPDFWQFPTVSMGLGPIVSIYQARFNKYLVARGLIKKSPNVWCFIGDGETDEPETLGALTVASREKLNNLTFIVSCNLQRLDGPVRGNGKIIQELESMFTGAGWQVIKVIWGSGWDKLLQSDHRELLLKRMREVVDGEYQKYVVEPGSYMRKHFFGKYPELLELVNSMTDQQIKELTRGGHDLKKIYAAYKYAQDYQAGPCVILAKTVKGYGLGEAGEGKNISHNQKKMNEKELRVYRDRLNIPINDEEIVNTPFFRPSKESKEYKYLIKQRKNLNGFLPQRLTNFKKLTDPLPNTYDTFYTESKSDISTTTAFVRILSKLLRDPSMGKYIVPIIPDEARTFGMESLFRQIGIYSRKGQLYEPVDRESLLYYREEKDGQILEEGINESGAMSSFISAGTAYANFGLPMIPFYIYYSMFGFQRVGDLMWLAGDIKAKGFLLGGTAGRTTLNGEGLQHQDGHSHLIASTIPNLLAYDPAFQFEIAVIIKEGLRRMYENKEDLFYYITLGNENYKMAKKPKDCEEGILKGLYKFKKGHSKTKHKGHLFGSGSIINEALKAQKILKEVADISVDVWSATSYKQLRTEALNCERKNILNPNKKTEISFLEKTINKESGFFVAASDNMKIIPDQIGKWIPGELITLGTDGFGRSDTRKNLRRFFEVDAESIIMACIKNLKKDRKVKKDIINKLIKVCSMDEKKSYPELVI